MIIGMILNQRHISASAIAARITVMASLLGHQAFSFAQLFPAHEAATVHDATAPAQHAAAAAGLQAVFSSKGLAKLTDNGIVLFDGLAHPGDAFRVVDYTLADAAGQNVHAGDCTLTWNAQTLTEQAIFSWGTVSCKYTTSAHRLDMDFTVANKAGSGTLTGLNLFPLALRFPKALTASYENGRPIHSGINDPAVVLANFGDGTVAFADNTNSKPLNVGFMPTSETPKTNRYDVRVGTSTLWYDEKNVAAFSRPVAAGATDTYSVSLRFGSAIDTLTTLAPDVLRKYYAPRNTLHWTDRRAIAAIMLPTRPDLGTVGNPQGWFADRRIDLRTVAGLDSFRWQLLKYADQCVAIEKWMNAQGVIVWNVEGEKYSPYVGDPTALSKTAPEMLYQNTVDVFFKKFTDAGLKVGVTIRPDHFEIAADGAATHTPVADPAQDLINKIKYAQSRWGTTIFYVDSNVANNRSMDASIFATVTAACPNVLLVPEHSTGGYYGMTAPYGQLSIADFETPSDILNVNPSAFRVVNAFGGDPIRAMSELVSSVKKGNILLFLGWYNAPNNSAIKSIYSQAAQK